MSNVTELKQPLKVVLYGTEYELSTKLRVAYKVQGQHSHKPYSEIFSQLDTMPIEKQIAILYCAFEVANPECTEEITSQKFLDWYLDNYDVKTIMEQLQEVIGGILGQDLKAEEQSGGSEADAGN